MKWKDEPIPENIKEGDYVGDHLHGAKCRVCDEGYMTILHESSGTCPDCEEGAG